MLKQRRGFFVSRDAASVVEDEKGQLCCGKEAADVWGRMYHHIGTARDDAEEKIQQANPLDEQFRQGAEGRLADLIRRMQADPLLDAPFVMKDLEQAIAG